MSKRENCKHKIDRRLGVNLWDSAKSPLAHGREGGPGQHGQRRKKLTDYGVQLHAKQKIKGYYANIGERQFRRYYQEAMRRKGDNGEILVQLLERRLDAVVYRMKFAPTPFAARQMVNHGHIKVNGQRVSIASYSLKDGDTVEVSEKMKQNANFLAAQQASGRDIPDYIQMNEGGVKGTFVRGPQLTDVPYPVKMEPNLVIEFYSR